MSNTLRTSLPKLHRRKENTSKTRMRASLFSRLLVAFDWSYEKEESCMQYWMTICLTVWGQLRPVVVPEQVGLVRVAGIGGLS